MQQQRRFEWDLARDQQTRSAARLVSGRTHDVLNLVQIVQLATPQLANECSLEVTDTIDELATLATAARGSLEELLGIARSVTTIVRGAPVGPAIDAAVGTLRDVIAVDLRLEVLPDTATRCSAPELMHLVIGMVLDAGDEIDAIDELAMLVRQRTIVGVPWVEIVRATHAPPEGDRFELRAVTAIIERAGGELATSVNRDGSFELVAALPVVVEREVVSSLS